MYNEEQLIQACTLGDVCHKGLTVNPALKVTLCTAFSERQT